ncbi:hypothetical protein [Acinetobacter baumannii]|uniref:hypothetical protein n=1 Tax=Acinetobacter baumannii TaxID=470 RepID=UPI000DE6F584|nr:hypothetical protein [Acinetobacter baumannii]SSR05943.1 Uncharacterised protein [Acinetobacter baumannii]
MKIWNFLKNKIASKELAETISLSLIFYLVLVCFALCIGLALSTIFGTENKDIPSVLSNMFVWSATLIAPIIAILLINTWRYQKNFDIDSNLLNSSEENLIKFNRNIDPVCRTVIKIYDVFSQNKSFYIAHSLMRRAYETSDQLLDEFYLNLERYLNYNENPELKQLAIEYYGIANDFLYINKDIITNHYSLIYYKLKAQPLGDGWADSYFTIGPDENPEKRIIENQYTPFNIRYEHGGITMEKDESGEIKSTRKTYKEYYELMDGLYKQINNKIREINRA